MRRVALFSFLIFLSCGSVKDYGVNELDLSGKGLKKLPSRVLKYKNLKTINLRKNKFKEFPSQLSQLPHLEKIFLSENLIDSIPLEILKFRNLKILDLEANRIRYFRDLSSMDSLRVISITYNPLKTINSIECLIPRTAEILYGNEFPSIKGSNCKSKNLKVMMEN